CLLAPGSGGRCRGEGRSHGPRFDCGGAGGGAGRQPAASAPGGAEDPSTPAVLLVADGGPDAGRDAGRGELGVTVRVAAVVLNWCGYESTVECVESVLASDGAEPIVLIVDNASPDGSGARLRGRFPELEVIEAGANLGYAGGNNLGIDRARALEAEYILILNNDVTIAPDCVRFMVETLEQNPRAALVGAKIVHAD